MKDFFQELPVLRKRIHDLARDVMHDRKIEMMLVGFEQPWTIAARFSILKISAKRPQCSAPFESRLVLFCAHESDKAIKQKIKNAFTND